MNTFEVLQTLAMLIGLFLVCVVVPIGIVIYNIRSWIKKNRRSAILMQLQGEALESCINGLEDLGIVNRDSLYFKFPSTFSVTKKALATAIASWLHYVEHYRQEEAVANCYWSMAGDIAYHFKSARRRKALIRLMTRHKEVRIRLRNTIERYLNVQTNGVAMQRRENVMAKGLTAFGKETEEDEDESYEF